MIHLTQAEQQEVTDLNIIVQNLSSPLVMGGSGEYGAVLFYRLLYLWKKEKDLEVVHQQNIEMWNSMMKVYPELKDIPLDACPGVFAEIFK